jgi:hypothetical protein
MLSLNRNYVAHWGVVNAVRELIQNAIDSESRFVYEFAFTDDTWTLRLRSEHTVLHASTLLLGTTSKADRDDAIGSFGEGYKVALLVLTRESRRVIIENGDKVWVPHFANNADFGMEVLAIDEVHSSNKNKGLTFIVRDLTETDVADIKASCLLMQDNIGAVKTSQYGEILLDRPGMLYVGGLYICKTDHKHGYNILPQFVKLERDRQTVNSWDLSEITTRMWYATEEYERIAQLIEDDAEDVSYARYSSPVLVKDACYRLFRANNPGAVAASSRKELEALVARGMEKVIVVNSGYHSCITESKTYQREERVAIETVQERLVRFLGKNRGDMRATAIVNFKQLILEAGLWTRK